MGLLYGKRKQSRYLTTANIMKMPIANLNQEKVVRWPNNLQIKIWAVTYDIRLPLKLVVSFTRNVAEYANKYSSIQGSIF